jgi:ABC-type microcin C transport system permease subunit YejB
MSIDEKLPRYIDSICKALNIKNDQELNQLMTLFEKHNSNHNEDIGNVNESMSDMDASISEEQKKNRNSLEIDPDKVMELLKEFYLEKKNKAKEQCK